MSRNPKIHPPLELGFIEVLEGVADQNKPAEQTKPARPFLKWVGGKRSILGELKARLPKSYGTYREPFIGGGALFFETQPERASISDINFHLILTYKAVRDDVDGLISALNEHQGKHSPKYFANARIELTREPDPTKVAALMIYLNKTCFNGLYRVNKSGEFNVPIGSYPDPALYEEDVLRSDSEALQGVEITQKPFDQTEVVREDFYYFDPPYHETYDGYNGKGFVDDQHRVLADLCREIDAAKGYFMLSNSDTPFVRSLFEGFTIENVAALRSVSCKGNQRGKENELIIRNY
jgi:DNA adenine methylase